MECEIIISNSESKKQQRKDNVVRYLDLFKCILSHYFIVDDEVKKQMENMERRV